MHGNTVQDWNSHLYEQTCISLQCKKTYTCSLLLERVAVQQSSTRRDLCCSNRGVIVRTQIHAKLFSQNLRQ